jgi:hypothetical protein
MYIKIESKKPLKRILTRKKSLSTRKRMESLTYNRKFIEERMKLMKIYLISLKKRKI